MVTSLSDQVKLNKNSAKVQNIKMLKQGCPHFIWVVRDFCLTLQTKKIDYLNKFFQPEEYPNDSSYSLKRKEEKMKEIDRRNELIVLC